MRYRALKDCTDFDGRFYREGEVVELAGESRHSDFLEPLDVLVEDSEPSKPTRKKSE